MKNEKKLSGKKLFSQAYSATMQVEFIETVSEFRSYSRALRAAMEWGNKIDEKQLLEKQAKEQKIREERSRQKRQMEELKRREEEEDRIEEEQLNETEKWALWCEIISC